MLVEQGDHAGGIPVVEVAERYGVSRKTVHTRLRRYRQEGLPGLADRSHRPNQCPGQLATEIEARERRSSIVDDLSITMTAKVRRHCAGKATQSAP
jgi:transposase